MINYISFPEEAAKRLKDGGYQHYIALFENLNEMYNEYYIETTPRPNNLDSIEIGPDSLSLLQINIFRSILLSRSFIDGLATNNPLMCNLATRSFYESCGVVTFLHKKYSSYITGTISKDDMIQVIKNLTYGIRAKEGLNNPEKFPSPVSVMTLIDSLDFFNKRVLNKTNGSFRSFYDVLSEICHPNSYSNVLSFTTNPTRLRSSNQEFNTYSFSVSHFCSAILLYFYAINVIMIKIMEHEEIPKHFFNTK